MSTQPIIIQVVDQVDPTIAAKINGIGTAARASALDINNLQLAIDRLSVSSNQLTRALSPLPSAVSGLNSAFAAVAPSSAAIATSMTSLGTALATTQPVIVATSSSVATLGTVLTSVTPVAATLVTGISGITGSLTPLSIVAGVAGTSVGGLSTVLTGASLASNAASGSFTKLGLSLAGLSTVGTAVQTATVGVSGAVSKLSTALNATRTDTEILNTFGTTAQTVGVGASGAITSMGTSFQKATILAETGVVGLSTSMRGIPTVTNAASTGLKVATTESNALGNAFAQLTGRGVAAELGMGRLGGAIGRIGTITAGAGPFIIAALAVGAVIGAVLWYNKLQKAAEDLAKAQTALDEEIDKSVDKLLVQHETLVGLTEGPMAKYQAQLDDLSKKNISVDIDKINKVLEIEKSKWNDVNTFVERHNVLATFTGPLYIAVEFGKALGLVQDHWRELLTDAEKYIPQLQIIVDLMDKLTKQPPIIGPKEAQDWIQQQEQTRIAGTQQSPLAKNDLSAIIAESKQATDAMTHNNELANEHDILDTKKKLADTLALEKGAHGDSLVEYQQAATGFKNYLNQLYFAQQEFENTKALLIKGANGELLAEQRKAAAEQLKLFREELDQFKASGGTVKTLQEQITFVEAQRTGAGRGTQALGPLGDKAALPLNQAPMIDQTNKLTAEDNKLNQSLDTMIQKYKNSIEISGAYTDEMKSEAEANKLLTEMKQRGATITDELTKKVLDATTAGVAEQKINKDKAAIYNEFLVPLQHYQEAIKAANQLESQGTITSQQATMARLQSIEALKKASDPLYTYNEDLKKQTVLLGKYGDALTIETRLLDLEYQMKGKRQPLNDQEIAYYRQVFTEQEREKAVQNDLNKLWADGKGAIQANVDQLQALKRAYDEQTITQGQYKAGILQTDLAMNKLNNEMTGGSFKSNVLQMYGGLIPLFNSMQSIGAQTAQNLTKNFTTFFGSLNKGFADSIAHVLVFGGSLKTALLDMARNAVAQLISSLIELGIQLLIVTALEKVFGISLPKQDDTSKKQLETLAIGLASIALVTTAEMMAISALMGPAWSLAEAVSLFSFGANAAAATAGISTVVAAGTAAQAAGKFAEGGLIRGPGTGRSDDVLIRASNGEFVVQAKATTKNRNLLEAINQGADIVKIDQSNAKQTLVAALPKAPTTLPTSISKFANGGFIDVHTLPKFADGGIVGPNIIRAFADGGFVNTQTPQGVIIDGSNAVKANGAASSSVGSGVKLNVNVLHDGSTAIKVQQIDATTVRIIARQEASQVVQTDAAKVIAADLYNPNSRTSKAVNRSLVAPRKR